MSTSFDPEHLKNLAAGFVVDDLTPAEAEEFQLMLEHHPETIAEINELQEVLRQVVDGFTEVEAPLHLLPNLLDRAEASTSQSTLADLQIQQLDSAQPTLLHRQTLRERERSSSVPILRQWRKIVGGIAALVVVGLGIDNYRLRENFSVVVADNRRLSQDVDRAQTVKSLLQNSQTRLVTFRSVNSANNSSGSIIINPDRQKAMMIFQNLSAPPPGSVYLLWTVIADRKLPCGQVKPPAWGSDAYELPFTNQMYKEFAHPQFSGLIVTLETDVNVSEPTGTVVMQSSQI